MLEGSLVKGNRRIWYELFTYHEKAEWRTAVLGRKNSIGGGLEGVAW